MMSQANETLLQIKYARIVNQLGSRLAISPLRALDLFYRSKTYVYLRKKEADLHCMSDGYLVDELIIEYSRKQGV
ncbi:MAG: DUF3791 domain-containing protein [Bacteroidales bacterium]